MAILQMSGVNCGEVIEYQDDSEFPCMDSNYRERSIRFTVLKEFASYSSMLTFENTTIPSYFSDRTKTVSYGSLTVNNVSLQSFKKKNRLNSLFFEYEIIFTKEG